MFKAILAAALLASIAPAIATPLCLTAPQPPASATAEPSVAYDMHSVSPAMIERLCGPTVVACSYPTGTRWTILLPNDVDLAEYACLVRYEKAHLPPNYWGDPRVETSDTMALLAKRGR